MKYSLASNAMSSLHIAIEHFKVFFYKRSGLSQSIVDENIKISLTFLENAIELLLKTILVVGDETSIYVEPNSKAIKRAKSKKSTKESLSDILIKTENVKTITYTETVEKYNNLFHKSNKLYHILHSLGEKRNQITHFGIEILKYDEILVLFFNVFDVIYNYLYPQLIELEDIGEYFTSDEYIVETIHGNKRLFDEKFIYNNIVDFLDELLGDCRDYFCSARAKNPDTKIDEFKNLFLSATTDRKFMNMCRYYNVGVDLSACKCDDNDYNIGFIVNYQEYDCMFSHYSPYFNATIFLNEAGNIIFLVLHEKGEMYIYSKDVSYPGSESPEKDEQWIMDMKQGFCKKVNLSKRNIIKVFDSLLSNIRKNMAPRRILCK